MTENPNPQENRHEYLQSNWKRLIDSSKLNEVERSKILNLPDDIIEVILNCRTAHKLLTLIPELEKEFPGFFVAQNADFHSDDLGTVTEKCRIILIMFRQGFISPESTSVRIFNAIGNVIEPE